MINGINTCLFYKGLRFKHNIERGENENRKNMQKNKRRWL